MHGEHKSEAYLKYQDLEGYVFGEVKERFRSRGFLKAFDFFCIIIWKANRAKSKVAKRLLEKGRTNHLDFACQKLTSALFKEKDNEERLRILLGVWGLRLPMASAVLSVLYPAEFTVYDRRVCDSLGKHHHLDSRTIYSRIQGYFEFLEDVRKASPQEILRGKGRELWGKSFCEGLERDIEKNFEK